jgi:hypothetical protein
MTVEDHLANSPLDVVEAWIQQPLFKAKFVKPAASTRPISVRTADAHKSELRWTASVIGRDLLPTPMRLFAIGKSTETTINNDSVDRNR